VKLLVTAVAGLAGFKVAHGGVDDGWLSRHGSNAVDTCKNTLTTQQNKNQRS
jgi:hypothetical protein